MNANLYAVLRERFPADPESPLLLAPDGRVLSYGEAGDASARLARVLGVAVGDRVMVQTSKSFEVVLLYLACLRAGAVYVPLNTAYATEEVEYFATDAEPVLLVCEPENKDALAGLAPRVEILAELMEGLDGAEPLETVERGEDDIAAILYTSGTTGRSKGAMISHGNLSSNGLALHRIWGWRDGEVLLHALPIYHVHGLFVAIHCAMLNGSPMWFLPGFDADAIVSLLPKSTVLMGVPTFYTRLLSHPGLKKDAVKDMRLFISGSAPLLEETFRAFEDRTGHRILERYGMTEAGMITSNPLDGARVAGTVGYPLPDVRARLADENGAPVAEGDVGILEITGPNVFRGYWRMPDKTAAEFRPDGWFITGDMARMDEDGRVSIVGRARDLIISGGLNVYPKEVELLIDSLPGVNESAVIGLKDPDLGEAVCAVVAPDGARELDEAEIKASLAGRIAKFKQPKRFFFVDALPRNAMGKVQKNALRERYS